MAGNKEAVWYVLIFIVFALLLILIIAIVVIVRRRKEREKEGRSEAYAGNTANRKKSFSFLIELCINFF